MGKKNKQKTKKLFGLSISKFDTKISTFAILK
jgi:hypothetical protein